MGEHPQFDLERCAVHDGEIKNFKNTMAEFKESLSKIGASIDQVKNTVNEIKVTSAKENAELRAQITAIDTKVDNFNKTQTWASDIFKTVLTSIITTAILGGLAFSILNNLKN